MYGFVEFVNVTFRTFYLGFQHNTSGYVVLVRQKVPLLSEITDFLSNYWNLIGRFAEWETARQRIW